MHIRQRAHILHGLSNIELELEHALQGLKLERAIHVTTEFDCCISHLERLITDIQYGIKEIKEAVDWKLD